MNTENTPLNENFKQVCVWEACVVGQDKTEEFIQFMQDTFGVRAQYLEEVETAPTPGDPESGGRNDLIFAIHNDDITKFAIPRLEYGIRWIEDAYRTNGSIWPWRFTDYKCW